jgi:hypothetical protein
LLVAVPYTRKHHATCHCMKRSLCAHLWQAFQSRFQPPQALPQGLPLLRGKRCNARGWHSGRVRTGEHSSHRVRLASQHPLPQPCCRLLLLLR